MATIVFEDTCKDFYREIDIWVIVYTDHGYFTLPDDCPWMSSDTTLWKRHMLSRFYRHQDAWTTIETIEDGNPVIKHIVFLNGSAWGELSTYQLKTLRRRIESERYLGGRNTSIAGASLNPIWFGASHPVAINRINQVFDDLDVVIYCPYIPF